MKKSTKIKILEALGEFAITCLCFGVGLLIFSFIGEGLEYETMNGDLIALVGAIVLLVIVVACYFVVRLVKNKIKKIN